MDAPNFKADVARYNYLVGKRATREGDWDLAARYMMPIRTDMNAAPGESPAGSSQLIFNDIAITANNNLASGLVSSITPATERWAAFEAPATVSAKLGDGKNASDRWYQEVTDIIARVFADSNFHTEIHEMHLARNVFCTGAIACFEGEDSPLVFKAIPPKTYVFTEDAEGKITSFYRELPMTIEQLAGKFGADALPVKFREKLTSDNPADALQELKVLHVIKKRDPRSIDTSKLDAENKPYSSDYILLEGCVGISSGGFTEMPVAVGRFLKWGADSWGYGPGISALPTVRQLNFLEEHADVIAEKAAFPSLLIPTGMKGKVDIAAAGMTFFDPNQPNAMPKVWGAEGRGFEMDTRIERKEASVRSMFFNDLFQMLQGIDPGKMTAYETMQRFTEKLAMFSPSFKMVTTEVLTPLLKRAFSILFKLGYFPEPPQEVLVETPEGYVLPMPQVAFVSKLALAIRAIENQSFSEFMALIGPMLQINPEVADGFDFDAAFAGIARNCAVPPAWIRSNEDRDKLRADRQAAQQQAAQAQQAMEMAKAAGDLGKAPPALQEAAGQMFQ